MRNDVTATYESQPANAAPIGRRLRRGLVALPLALALIAPGATALAAEATTGYSQTTPAPKTTPSPKQEAAPTQTSNTPTSETPTSSTEPTATTAHASTLPFTGLDLRWVIVGGVLLLGMGMSIMVVQRGRHGTGR